MMNIFRVWLIGLLLLLIGINLQAQGNYDPTDYERTLEQLVNMTVESFQFQGGDLNLFRAIREADDPLYIAPLIDIGYFLRLDQTMQRELFITLQALTGGVEPELGWATYFEWAAENDVARPPGYAEFKGDLLGLLIDPQFKRFWDARVQDTARVNLVEPVWGGVRVDGIPSLVNARQITPDAAAAEGERFTDFCRAGDCTFPASDELVFGVYLDDDARAYPLRMLNWHEMFNDVIGHTPLFSLDTGDTLCHFRAPTIFKARGYSLNAVVISGYSPGCPEEGFISLDAVEWVDSDWETVRDRLPDIAAGEALLDAADGIEGRVIGRPIMLAYCTLCGSGVLYDTTVEDLSYVDYNGNTIELGDTVLEFGSTGMLMRSNKLMYDRNTDTVWNALTGEPAFGPLATSDVLLDLLPVVVTDWETWLRDHPDTSVLSMDTGYRRNYTNGAAYSDYFNSPELMFPVFQQEQTRSDNKDMIFGLRLDGAEKAYPLAILIDEQVTNDTLGETDVVIITHATPQRDFFEPGGAAVRAYDSRGIEFSVGEAEKEIIDADGNSWRVTENALISADGRTLERLPGHLAFWFGWFGFYPDTLYYEGNAE